MTSAFSWQNAISLCPASFCTPRPNLPVTPGISWLPTFAFQYPIMKRTSFLGVSCKSLVDHHQIRSVTQSCLTLCNPMNCSMPGLPVHHQLPEFTQTHVHRVSDAIHHRTVQLQLLLHYWSGHRLGLPWHWMVCLGNRDHSLVFEIASKYCISDSFVDYNGYFISSQGFLPTVVVGQDVVVVGCSRCSLRYNGHLS